MADYVLYCRVSTSRQDLGLDAQREQAMRYVERTGGRIVAEFSEHESGKVDSRPQLAAAIAEAKARHSTLLIAKLDRLSRRVAFLFNLKDELAKSGVDVVAADMPEVVRDTLTLGVCQLEKRFAAVDDRLVTHHVAAQGDRRRRCRR